MSCRVVSFVRGQVLRPIVVVAPATHSFGTIHTQRRGNATLYVGNPTYVDAEWTLSHIPAPPPKHRLFESNQASKAAAASAASAAAVATGRRLTGQSHSDYLDGRTAGGRGSPLGGLADASSNPPCSRETNGRRTSGVASLGGSGDSRGGRSKKLSPTAPPAATVAAAAVAAAPAGVEGTTSFVTPFFVDDPSVFVFNEEVGVARGVKLPLSSSASCLPEDWNRLEVSTIATASAVAVFRADTCLLSFWPIDLVEKNQRSKCSAALPFYGSSSIACFVVVWSCWSCREFRGLGVIAAVL